MTVQLKKERGAILIYSLLLLLVMSLLAISSISNSVLEERMSGNYQQSQTSLQSAEFALRVAEVWLVNNVSQDTLNSWFTIGGRKGLYSKKSGDDADAICDYSTSTNDTDCNFNPRLINDWCDGSEETCPLQKGFVTLGTNDLETGSLPTDQSSPANLQPRFVIEYQGQYGMGGEASNNGGVEGYQRNTLGTGNFHVFNVTAIGWGNQATVRTVLQSSYHIPL